MVAALASPITQFIRVTPVVSASPDYGIDDVLGTLMTISSPFRGDGAGGILNAINMVCDVDIPSGVTIDMLFFDQNPTNSTFTDNSALAVNVNDLPYMLPAVQLTTRIDLGTPCMLQATGFGGIPVENAAKQRKLYAVAVVRGAATLNLAAVDDVTFGFGFLPD